MKLSRDFFNQPTIKISKQLLGKFLIRKIRGKELAGKIVETEAYIGPDDRASHAAFGKTKRCKPMYDKAGTAYVYFIYGMYWMLNIVTEEKGKPCAVLVRAIEPINTSEVSRRRNTTSEVEELRRLGNGPGKLCQWMKIDRSFNGEDLVTSSRLYLTSECPTRIDTNKRRTDQVKPWMAGERRSRINTNEKFEIVATKRIGIDYAGKWAEKSWRFYIKGNPYVSKK